MNKTISIIPCIHSPAPQDRPAPTLVETKIHDRNLTVLNYPSETPEEPAVKPNQSPEETTDNCSVY
jgi:hypothetical protein